jgi:RNA polymerase sigma factor (sigma-70 family)
MTSGSVSHWIEALKKGDQAAAQFLWERYHARLLGLARQKLQSSHRRHADEEDVVQNAFGSFFKGMVCGRFPRLNDRDDLWRLLVVITARKAIDQLRRDGRGNVTLRTPTTISSMEDEAALEEIVGDEPTPELASQLIEEYENLLIRLSDRTLQQVAVWKLEGFNNSEIASKLTCSRRTVIRKLETIRLIWSEEPGQ